jgi:hypothetical protein
MYIQFYDDLDEKFLKQINKKTSIEVFFIIIRDYFIQALQLD